jgi:hypothetical protein
MVFGVRESWYKKRSVGMQLSRGVLLLLRKLQKHGEPMKKL